MEALRRRFEELDAQFARFFRLTDPHARQHLQQSVAPRQLLEAQARLPNVRAEHARVRLQLADAEAALQEAREVEREKQRAVLHQQKREALQRLKATLLAARAASAVVAELEDREHALLGAAIVDRFAWPEFGVSGPTFTTKLDCWLQVLEDYGFE